MVAVLVKSKKRSFFFMGNIDNDTVALKLVEILFRQGVIDMSTYQNVIRKYGGVVKSVDQ